MLVLSRSAAAVATSLPRSCRLARYASTCTEGKVAVVPDRGVLEVSGRDTVKLFQGLVSNDVNRLSNNAGETMLFAALMNPQGRMLADLFIHAVDSSDTDGPRWLIETDSRTFDDVLSFIKKFKLRSKCKLEDASHRYSVVQAWNETETPSRASGSVGEWGKDPRAPGMGHRTIVAINTDLGPAKTDSIDYHIHRTLLGVGEGCLDFPYSSSLPLENNIDYMNGVDFRKGCYVGQELTARTHHTGVVRKRLIPLSFYPLDSPSPTTLSVDRSPSFALPASLTEVRSKPVGTDGSQPDATPRRGKAAGKFTSGIHNLGLGCLRLEQALRWQDASSQDAPASNSLQMTVESADGTTLLVKPWIPTWWPEQPKTDTQQ